jgi:protein TonB
VVLLIVTLVGLAACAAPQAPAPASALPHVAPSEDAAPALRVYAPDEVDVPATPRTAIEPVYPERARQLGTEGMVDVRATVLAGGTVHDARAEGSPDPELAASALDAVQAARFLAARLRGREVASWVIVRVRFELAD